MISDQGVKEDVEVTVVDLNHISMWSGAVRVRLRVWGIGKRGRGG
jgi:hypothetical protein